MAIKQKYNYKISSFQKYSPEKIGQAVHKSRNVNFFYGLAFSIKTLKDGNEVCFYIERGDQNIYYGLMIKNKDDEWAASSDGLFEELKSHLSDIEGIVSRPFWMGIKYFEPKINFKAFNEEHTLLLKNKKQREEQLKKYLKDIDGFLKEVTEWLKKKSLKVNI